MKKFIRVLVMIMLALSGMMSSSALAAMTCESVFSKFSNLDSLAEGRLERARVVLGRSLDDVEIEAVLRTSSEKLYKKDVDVILREAGFKAGEAKSLIDFHIALPEQPIVFNDKQLKQVEDVLRDPSDKLKLTDEEKANLLAIIKSGSPQMGSQLASAVGITVLGHKTESLFLESILKRGAIIPGLKVKDEELRRRAYYRSLDLGSTGFATLIYDRAFFQPFSAKWKDVKNKGGYFFIFDLKLFDDPTADFNNFYAHSQVGFKLREDPAAFLQNLVLAGRNNQSELKTKVGLSLMHVKYIVVPTESYAYTLKMIQEKRIQPPPGGRSWEELLVPSDLILGGK